MTTYNINNRDIYTTELHLEGIPQTISVNPGEIYMNMLENLPETIQHTFVERFKQFQDDLTRHYDSI